MESDLTICVGWNSIPAGRYMCHMHTFIKHAIVALESLPSPFLFKIAVIYWMGISNLVPEKETAEPIHKCFSESYMIMINESMSQ